MSILLVAEHDNWELKAPTLNAVTAASELGEVIVLIAGYNCVSVADQAANVSGVTKVIVADDVAFANGLAENVSSLLVDLAPGYSHLVAPATTSGKNIMPRVAALLDVSQISEITKVVDANTFVRPIYAGNAMATVKSADNPKVITVRCTAFDAAAIDGGSAAIEAVSGGGNQGISSFVAQTLTKSERPDLTSARVVISGGRGMQSGDGFRLLEDIADKLNAAVGASRAAVDAGYAPNDYQVGQTGKVVAPDLYVAVGISGAIQHLAGRKDSKVIVAINKDREAPIFQIADYGIVTDLFEVLPQLSAELDKIS
jgi:electron transfer flavoprotein alpha subunit